MENFTNKYSLSKTLRFELIPQGKTLHYIQKNGLLKQDEERTESYKKVKKIIDEYHKYFIKKSLENFKLNQELLQQYYEYYNIKQRDEKQKEKFKELQNNLRKEIADRFNKHPIYKNIFSKELIKKDLIDFVKENQEEIKLVKEFENFTTYFTGFYENRKNMYSAEYKSTAIAYRLVHENLPKFIDNINVFEQIKNTSIVEKFEELYKDMEMYLNVNKIEDIFSLGQFSNFLTQEQIDVYNAIIGGKSEENGKAKVQGLNEYINLYNQQQKDKNQRLPKLKQLFKQILSDRNTISWLPEEFEKGEDNKVLESIAECYQQFCAEVFFTTDNKYSLKDLLLTLKDYNLDKIYLKNDATLTDISQQLFGSWTILQKAVETKYANENPKKNKETEEQFDDRKSKFFKNTESFSIVYLNECLSLLGDIEKDGKICTRNIADYFISLGKIDDNENLFTQLKINYKNIEELLKTPYPENKDLSQEKSDVAKIKLFLDSLKAIQRFIKPLFNNNEADKDEKFYGEFIHYWESMDKITPLYNKVRNYMTKKPYSEEKFKLNFENSYFLNGWSKDYDTKAGLIFVKNGLYYLGINNKKLSEEEKDFLKTNIMTANEAERIILDFQKPDNKNIPRLFIRSKGDNFSPAVSTYNLPINEVLEIYDNDQFKKEYKKINTSEYFKSLYKMIDYFKFAFKQHQSYKHYNFAWKDTKDYNDITEFYKDVETSCYEILKEKINWDNLLKLVSEGKLYLFQIYNKDFSPYSKGMPNMHTIYWKMLFDKENLKNVVYKLNGQAEIFYRKSSIKKDNIIIHKAKQTIDNKNQLNPKKESLFEYDIVKDRRYTVDKFQFHVPITMNFKATGSEYINQDVNEFLKNNNDIHIIGIDRGERHLLYLTLIDLNGNIKKQISLNEILNRHNGNEYKTDYHLLLDKREAQREKERQSWQTIETIKELKEGYISQVIHKICELMVENKAIVVLEDLNSGFMRGRQKVEKQVYQKFEKMLIDKLNYLVDKKKPIDSVGGVLKALQLTNKFESFKKLWKQSGFLFYVNAWNTSKIDPVTGFVNLFNTRYENIEKARIFFSNFKIIKFNRIKNYFEFTVNDYSKFNAKSEGTKQNWVICTYGTRIKTFRNSKKNNSWDSEEINLTEQFIKLFQKYRIDIQSDKSLKNIICMQTQKEFFEELLHLFKLTLQMRNSKTNTEEDYLLSPVADKKGKFYDSREYEKTENPTLPRNADANGAYNIARKGIMIIDKIKSAENLKKPDLSITNKEWLKFAQK